MCETDRQYAGECSNFQEDMRKFNHPMEREQIVKELQQIRCYIGPLKTLRGEISADHSKGLIDALIRRVFPDWLTDKSTVRDELIRAKISIHQDKIRDLYDEILAYQKEKL